MAVDDKRFAADLRLSDDAVMSVANWLLLKRGVEVYKPPPPPHSGSDHGDLYMGGLRLEVKWRHDRPEFQSFTSPADYPYPDVLVCEAYRFDDTACRVCSMPLPQPTAIFNVNGDLTHAVVAYDHSSPLWEKRQGRDSRYGDDRWFYYAPFKACTFYDIRVD